MENSTLPNRPHRIGKAVGWTIAAVAGLIFAASIAAVFGPLANRSAAQLAPLALFFVAMGSLLALGYRLGLWLGYIFLFYLIVGCVTVLVFWGEYQKTSDAIRSIAILAGATLLWSAMVCYYFRRRRELRRIPLKRLIRKASGASAPGR